MRSAVMGSLAAHVVIVTLLFIVRVPAPVVVPGPEVVQVSLVSPDVQAPPVQAPPPKPQPRAVPTVVPEKGEGVKLAPVKPPPKPPVEVKKPEPPAEPAPALPYARVGPAGLRGQVVVDSRDFEFTYYLMLVRNRIAQNWSPPAGLAGGATVEAVAYFQIGRDGSVRGLRLEQPSGFDYFDRSVTRAVVLSDPLPPLPLGYTQPQLGVHFGFQWGGP